jgi:hypothetical protein
MMRKIMDLHTGIKYCMLMWGWMSKNPGKEKREWPMLETIEKKYGDILHACFACHLCVKDCSSCPLIGLFNPTDYYYDGACENNPGSPYRKWYDAYWGFRFKEASHQATNKRIMI